MSTLRDELRAKLLATREPTSEVIDFFGGQIELRQPTLADILKATASKDQNAAVINTLVNYAYVPGTDERIFEDTDAASLLSLPFGGDFMRVSQALERLTQVNFLDRSTASVPTPSPSSSVASAGNSG